MSLCGRGTLDPVLPCGHLGAARKCDLWTAAASSTPGVAHVVPSVVITQSSFRGARHLRAATEPAAIGVNDTVENGAGHGGGRAVHVITTETHFSWPDD